MVNKFEVLFSTTLAAPVVDAETRTGVLTTPALTMVCTNPALSEVAVEGVGVRVTPPAVALTSTANVTVFPLNGFPLWSRTLNTIREDSVPPVPLRFIKLGEADTNCIEPDVGAVTLKEAEEVPKPPPTDAVMVSVPAQPISR